MKIALGGQGIQLGFFKISRLMKEAGIITKEPKKPHYYPSGNERPDIPNQLNRQFNPGQVNTHWVGDITYIHNHGDWSYLATVLDLGSREIVGYALSTSPDARLTREALLNAIRMQQPDTHQLMLHSNQGVQYTADQFKKTLSIHGINQSMSRRGNCWDNAVQERFFRSLKSEHINGQGAAIQVYGADVWGVRGRFAIYTWIATRAENETTFTIHQIIGWKIRRAGTALGVSQGDPNRYWYRSPSILLHEVVGDAPPSLVTDVRDAISTCPYPDTYTM
jgi:transposase InsO family protein